MSLTMNLFVLCMHDEKLIGYSGINVFLGLKMKIVKLGQGESLFIYVGLFNKLVKSKPKFRFNYYTSRV
jgi:hypothetical protein